MSSVLFVGMKPASNSHSDKTAFLDACKKRTTEVMDYNTKKPNGCMPCLGRVIEAEWCMLLDEYFPEFPDAFVEVIICKNDYTVNYNGI